MSDAVRKILMVDDDREDAFLMKRALKQIDKSVEFEHFVDSEEFVEWLGAPPEESLGENVLLIDLNMPGLNGFDVISAARSAPETRDVDIVMLTSSDRVEDQKRALELGANRFATKPNTIRDLAALAKTILQVADS